MSTIPNPSGPAQRRAGAGLRLPRSLGAVARRHRTEALLPVLLIAMLGLTRAIHPGFGPFDIQSLAMSALPLAVAAAAQAVIVIGGGIDLSIGSVMAVCNCLAARTMQGASTPEMILLVALVLLVGVAAGTLNGAAIVWCEVPDVVVTLTTGFIWGGVALMILPEPGGGASDGFLSLGSGATAPWLPNALLLLLGTMAVVWWPLSRSKLFIGIRSVGSDRVSAFRSGVHVESCVIASYAVGGLFSAVGGLFLVMTTGIGSPLGSAHYTLSSVAAIVLGGVSLTGGRGRLFGPLLGAYVLSLIPALLIFAEIDPNYGQVVEGALMVGIVMIAGRMNVTQKGMR